MGCGWVREDLQMGLRKIVDGIHIWIMVWVGESFGKGRERFRLGSEKIGDGVRKCPKRLGLE